MRMSTAAPLAAALPASSGHHCRPAWERPSSRLPACAWPSPLCALALWCACIACLPPVIPASHPRPSAPVSSCPPLGCTFFMLFPSLPFSCQLSGNLSPACQLCGKLLSPTNHSVDPSYSLPSQRCSQPLKLYWLALVCLLCFLGAAMRRPLAKCLFHSPPPPCPLCFPF